MTPAPKRNKVLQSLYLEPEQAKTLDLLAARTRVPKAVLLREAVDNLLRDYRNLKWLDETAEVAAVQTARRRPAKPK